MKGGEKPLKKVAVVTLALALLMLVVTVAPAVSAQPKSSLRCEVSVDIDWGLPGWRGTVTGDIEGTITSTLDVTSVWVKDDIEHFRETFEIVTDDGTISGFNEGIYMLKNDYLWVAYGEVTVATGDWAYLVGSREHELGTTTPFDWFIPVHGEGALIITAG